MFFLSSRGHYLGIVCILLCLLLSACASHQIGATDNSLELRSLITSGLKLTAPIGQGPEEEMMSDSEAAKHLLAAGLKADRSASFYLYAEKNADVQKDSVRALVQKAATQENHGWATDTGDWNCFSGKVTLRGKLFPNKASGAGGQWVVANLIGGSMHLYQGLTLAFPQGQLSHAELQQLLSELGPSSLYVPVKVAVGEIMVQDMIIRKPYDWKWRVSCYYMPDKDSAFTVMLVFQSIPAGLDYAP